MKRKVNFEREPDGWWVASVPGVPGCHTQGRSLAQARERIKEALAVSLNHAEEPEIVERLKLPKSVESLLALVRSARKTAKGAEVRSHALNARAARTLTSAWGVSLRDAADLLGLSHQRVAQILEADRPTVALRDAEARR